MERLISDVINVILFYLEDKSKVKLLMLNKKTTKKIYDIIFFDEFHDEKTIIKMTSENIIAERLYFLRSCESVGYVVSNTRRTFINLCKAQIYKAAARKIYTMCKFFSQQLRRKYNRLYFRRSFL